MSNRCRFPDHPGGRGFRVTKSEHDEEPGAPASYPRTTYGCTFGTCSRDAGLPRHVGDGVDVRSSWQTVQPDQGMYNVAYDIWYHPTRASDTAAGGTELMIWLNQVEAGFEIWRGGVRLESRGFSVSVDRAGRTPGGRCLDLRFGDTAAGTPVQLCDCNGSEAQRRPGTVPCASGAPAWARSGTAPRTGRGCRLSPATPG
jgi:hypothetical protein